MKRMILFIMIAILFTPVVALAQEEETENLKQELAETKIALLAQRQATIQAKAAWLDREKILLAQEVNLLNNAVAALREELAETFECAAGYDLQKKACNPEPESTESEKEK